jgi:putative lipoprotein
MGKLRRARATALAMVVLLTTSSAARAQQRDDDDPWFGHDKALHFTVSASLAMVAYAGASLKTDDRPTRVAAAITFALGAGLLKEAWDLTGHGDASWRDLTWDVVGTTTGVLVAYAIDWAVSRLRGPGAASKAGSMPATTSGTIMTGR